MQLNTKKNAIYKINCQKLYQNFPFRLYLLDFSCTFFIRITFSHGKQQNIIARLRNICIVNEYIQEQPPILQPILQRTMVNQSQVQVNSSFQFRILDRLTENISRTNLPEFIINFTRYERWPKLLFKRYKIQEREERPSSPLFSSEIVKKMEKALVCIYERLSQLGDFGDLFKRKFSNEVEHFCPSLKRSNYIIEYSPSAIDKQLIKIVEFHQNKETKENKKYKFPNEFENNNYLAELEEKIKIFYEMKRKNEKDFQETSRLDRETNYLFSPFFRQSYVDRNCLRCTTHFIYNTTTNACNPRVSFYPFDAYELTSYDSFAAIENNVKASMCAMLNEPSGGIILLGCEKEGPTTILPKGLLITEKQKDSLQQKLEGYLTKISPKVKRNQEIFIDFVPIIQIKENPNKNSKQLLLLEPVHGCFVCRIFMLPKQNYKVYLLKASNENSSLEVKKGEESITIPDSDHYSFIIEKFQKFYDPDQTNDKITGDKLGVRNSHYNIKCYHPLTGKLAYDKKAEEELPIQKEEEPAYQNITQKKVQQAKPVKIVDLANKKPQDYKLWTLVVGDKNTMQKLIECANSQKQNKGIKIQQMYADCKFKLTKTTWVMFHDQKFESMKKLAEKHSITYKSKQIKMIASNVYLQVENSIAQQHYYNLYNILAVQYQCQIKDCVAKEIQGKQLWILWFDQLKGSIYAYFYLSELNYKVRFIRGASHFKHQNSNNLNNQPQTNTMDMNGYSDYHQGYQTSGMYQQQYQYGTTDYSTGYSSAYPQGYYQGGYGNYSQYQQ